MYKSSKFYYKKKMEQECEKGDKRDKKGDKDNKDDKTVEKYKGFTKSFLRSIDGYIMEKIKEESKVSSTTDLDVVPIKLYNDYCKKHQDDIKKEILRLREFHRKINGEVFSEKLKKTFSHRFYNVKQGINKV